MQIDYMLEEDLTEIISDKLPARNLKFALLALGYAILASVASFLALDTLGPGSGQILARVLIGLYVVLTIVSGVYAFLACRGSLKSLQTNKNTRNYVALVLGGLLLAGIVWQIVGHF